LCGLLVFSTVFSVQFQEGKSKEQVIGVLKENGPANTGLTFIWMPILFRSINVGQFLCAIFFLCITLAGLSSLISLVELPVHALADFGIQRIPATILVGVVMFSIGLASAFDVNILVNQDGVWAYAMILSIKAIIPSTKLPLELLFCQRVKQPTNLRGLYKTWTLDSGLDIK